MEAVDDSDARAVLEDVASVAQARPGAVDAALLASIRQARKRAFQSSGSGGVQRRQRAGSAVVELRGAALSLGGPLLNKSSLLLFRTRGDQPAMMGDIIPLNTNVLLGAPERRGQSRRGPVFLGAGGARCVFAASLGVCHCCVLDPALHFFAADLRAVLVPDAVRRAPRRFGS